MAKRNRSEQSQDTGVNSISSEKKKPSFTKFSLWSRAEVELAGAEVRLRLYPGARKTSRTRMEACKQEAYKHLDELIENETHSEEDRQYFREVKRVVSEQ